MTTVSGSNPVSADLLASMNPKATTANAVDDAQNRFMTLLVTQMKNQDPMNPMDNAQVTSQFAQLSTVTGINKLNDALGTLQSSYQASQTLQATSMIGHGVLVPGSNVALSSEGALMGADFTSPADTAVVTISDASGRTVRTMNLGSQKAGIVPIAWDGKTDKGEAAAVGDYSFTIQATQGGSASKATALSFGQVSSVTTGAAGIKLNVPGTGTVSMSDVRQIL
jgi:flagellar basal-body rod modification protein FlgD